MIFRSTLRFGTLTIMELMMCTFISLINIQNMVRVVVLKMRRGGVAPSAVA